MKNDNPKNTKERDSQEKAEQKLQDLQDFFHGLNVTSGMSESEAHEEASKEMQSLLSGENTSEAFLNCLLDFLPQRFPDTFPFHGTEEAKASWIYNQFSSELRNVPHDITAEEVKEIFDRYYRPLVFYGKEYGIGLLKRIEIERNLDKILDKYQLAYIPDDKSPHRVSDDFASPTISGRALFTEVQRIKNQIRIKERIKGAIIIVSILAFLILLLAMFFKPEIFYSCFF